MKASAALAPALCEASRIVARVAAGRSLADELATREASAARAALIDLTRGTLRRYGRVQAIVRELSSRGRPDAPVEALLWCSLYALESGRYAEYTVVDQAVKACGLLERWSAKGYVNALLRAFLRDRNSLDARIGADPEARHQHPRWWTEELRASHPSHWQAIVEAGNGRSPMCLRVNRRRTAAASYLAKLEAAGIGARALGGEAVVLHVPVPHDQLPGFADGEVSVQDAGAQRAAHCLDLAPGQRVLDACAAPGGKSGHILELADVALTALDADPARCARVGATLERLALAAHVRCADCVRVDDWWDGTPYERILADVPCTASGVVRRHPDLKWLRRRADLEAFAERQAGILSALWRVLRADGKLLYVTCSVFAQENDAVIDGFISRTPGASRIALPDGRAAQWLPDADHEGFFYALLHKQA